MFRSDRPGAAAPVAPPGPVTVGPVALAAGGPVAVGAGLVAEAHHYDLVSELHCSHSC